MIFLAAGRAATGTALWCQRNSDRSAARHIHLDRGISSRFRGIWLRVNQQDQQAIDDLFRHLYQSAGRAGPRDPKAEASIQQHIQQGPPGLLYHMAQTLVGQQAVLRQLRAQLADCQQQLQQSGSSAGFAQAGWRASASRVTGRRTSNRPAGSGQAARASWPGQARLPLASAAASWRPKR